MQQYSLLEINVINYYLSSAPVRMSAFMLAARAVDL